MAGEHDAALAAGGGDEDTVRAGIHGRFGHALFAELLEVAIGELKLALVVVGIGLEIDELALARRMLSGCVSGSEDLPPCVSQTGMPALSANVASSSDACE